MLSPNPQGDDIKRRGLQEVISTLIKESRRACLPLPPCEDAESSRPSATQNRVLTGTGVCWHPDLRLLASRVVRNTRLLFVSQPIYDIFVIAVQTD